MTWQPTSDREIEILTAAKQSKERNWLKLTRFVCFVAHNYGTYGDDIRPSQLTMSEESGVSQRTISRYLEAADGLRFFTVEKTSVPGLCVTVRRIAPFWEPGGGLVSVDSPVSMPVAIPHQYASTPHAVTFDAWNDPVPDEEPPF
jgi:hypothetical protein